jgi:hypothetical protein
MVRLVPTELYELLQLFWDWSWQDLAEHDLLAMLSYVYTSTQSKILYVGHSQVVPNLH